MILLVLCDSISVIFGFWTHQLGLQRIVHFNRYFSSTMHRLSNSQRKQSAGHQWQKGKSLLDCSSSLVFVCVLWDLYDHADPPLSSLTVLWFGVPCQSKPGPANLPVSRIQPWDVTPRRSWHHWERRRQSGPTKWPTEVHGDVPYCLLPTDKIWVPASHGRRGT